jgi:nitroimidazol reductase NimA-like FMN-containing flavoprotein (pyridoxamine 5'-phosphate oxidase superfamily)
VAVEQGTCEAADEARRVVAANRYLTLATVGADGQPWATPLWFATRDGRELFWLSRPGARHSRNLAARPAVGLVVFDSSAAFGEAAALYAEALAEEVGAQDRARALAVVDEGADEHGLDSWDEERVTGAAQFRLYRARVTRAWVLDDRDGRVEVG